MRRKKKWRQPPITARRPAQQQFNNNSVTTTTVGINQLNRPFSSRSKLLRHFPLKCGNQRGAGNRHQTNTALPDMTKWNMIKRQIAFKYCSHGPAGKQKSGQLRHQRLLEGHLRWNVVEMFVYLFVFDEVAWIPPKWKDFEGLPMIWNEKRRNKRAAKCVQS